MTEDAFAEGLVQARERTLNLYYAASVLCLIGIGVLGLYIFRLGPLVGPGVEQSFGYATALLFLLGALLFHMVDQTYRVWPMGRRIHPTPPGPVTDRMWRNFLAVAVLVAAGAGIAYVIGGLLS